MSPTATPTSAPTVHPTATPTAAPTEHPSSAEMREVLNRKIKLREPFLKVAEDRGLIDTKAVGEMIKDAVYIE